MIKRLFIALLFLLPITVILQQNGFSSPIFAFADEEVPDDGADVLEGEDANVEEAPEAGDIIKTGAEEEAEGGEEGEATQLKPSPDVDTFFLFTKPVGMGLDLPAGKDVHFLVGFANRGNKDFYIDTMDASFRYAQDFSFHLQNFTAIAYNRMVKPKQEVSLSYQFFVSEAYSTRPYGLTVALFYRDSDGNHYSNAVFNETVSIVELDEGLDGETFFLYVLMAAVVFLIAIVGHQLFLKLSKKAKLTSSKPKIEKGTVDNNGVDYDWLPEGALNSINKSPKAPKHSPRTSPRQRKVKRGTGSGDDK